jgi:hypothetical protein
LEPWYANLADRAAIAKAYHDISFEGYVRPDHGRMIWGETGKPGYGPLTPRWSPLNWRRATFALAKTARIQNHRDRPATAMAPIVESEPDRANGHFIDP